MTTRESCVDKKKTHNVTFNSKININIYATLLHITHPDFYKGETTNFFSVQLGLKYVLHFPWKIFGVNIVETSFVPPTKSSRFSVNW